MKCLYPNVAVCEGAANFSNNSFFLNLAPIEILCVGNTSISGSFKDGIASPSATSFKPLCPGTPANLIKFRCGATNDLKALSACEFSLAVREAQADSDSVKKLPNLLIPSF